MRKDVKKKLEEVQAQRDINNFSGELSRARSLTVGTAFGGVTEINLRSPSGAVVWCILQPVETVEIIHQLAASIGCHINIQPRNDFASWRKWKELDSGHARHPNDLSEHLHRGTVLPSPNQQPGMNTERKDHEPVATKKTVNRRSTKRAAAST